MRRNDKTICTVCDTPISDHTRDDARSCHRQGLLDQCDTADTHIGDAIDAPERDED